MSEYDKKPADFKPGDEIFRGIAGLSALETALILASRGVAIFPCELHSKSPATPHGFKDATANIRPYDHPKLPGYVQGVDPDGTELFLADHRYNWAFEPGGAGLFVVDIDPKNGGDTTWAELEARHGSIATRTVRTPSGGRHLYFHGTLPKVNKRLGPGIDTRCFGGYVLLPPSRVKGRTYIWIDDTVPIAPLPAWITQEIEEAAAREAEILNEFRHAYGDGHERPSFEGWLTLIGDHEGGLGFYNPMLSAAGAGVALGMTLDAILERLRETVEEADRHTHSLAEVRDRLSKMPGAIRSFQAKDAQRERSADEEVAEEELEEPYEADDEFEKLLAEPQAEEGADEHAPFSDEALAEDGADEPGGAATNQAGAAEAQDETDFDPEAERIAHEAAVDAAKYRLCKELLAVLDSSDPDKRLIKAAMGLGKTWTLLELLAERSDPANPTPVLRFEREERDPNDNEEPYLEALLDEDLSQLDALSPEIGQVVYVAQRHDLLEAAAEKVLKLALRKRGWSEEDIEENVVILSGRDRDMSGCQRPEEAKLISKAGGSVSDSLCFKRKTKTQPAVMCRFYEECEWQKTKRRAAHARFVLMTHAHLSSPFGLPGLPHSFHPQNADLVIIDEDPIAALIDEDETRIPAGSFCEHLPDEHNGSLIEEALTRSNTLDFLRAKDVTADKLPKYRKSRERRRRIGHPKMNLAERQAVLDQQQKQSRTPKLSRILELLTAEVKSGRSGVSYAMQRDPKTGDYLVRARKGTWNMSRQKVIVLDGTAEIERLRRAIPGITEVAIDVPRNAVIIQVYSGTYSKDTSLTLVKDAQGKTHFKPTALLRKTTDFMERCAKMILRDEKGRLRAAAFTTKAIRAALTHKAQKDKMPVAEEFGSCLIGHYKNIEGANDFEHCELGSLIGRNEWPWSAVEAEGKAWNFDSPRKLKFLGARGYPLKDQAIYRTKLGVKMPAAAETQEVTGHPDPDIHQWVKSYRDHGMFQALDRLRLVHNPDPKLVFVFTNIPLPIPVDMLVSDTEIDDARRLLWLIEEGSGLGWDRAIPLVPTQLHDAFPEIFKTARWAKLWIDRLRKSQARKIAEEVWRIADRGSLLRDTLPLSILTIRESVSQEASFTDPLGWAFAEYHVAGTKASEWSLFAYRGVRPSRSVLAVQLDARPGDLNLRTLGGRPLAALEDAAPPTGDALLDQTLAWCAAQSVAMPLSPEPLAALAGSPWTNAKAVKNWKEGVAVSEILRRGPPQGWSAAQYRLARCRGGRTSVAWVPPGIDPLTAISAALSVPESAVELKSGTSTTQEASREPPPPEPEPTPDAAAAEPPDPDNPSETPRPAKPPWSVPLATEFILETPSHRCTWFLVDPRAARRTKPLNFSSMLREEAGEGHLLSAADLGFTPDEPLHWMSADGAVSVLPYASLELTSGHMRAVH